MTIAWRLNRFLTTWRDAVNGKFPKRSKASDGTVGDKPHAERPSEHNPDRDGSVDAYDMDVNLNGSKNDEGTQEELRAIEELKAEFEKQPGAQLWIHRGEIANKDIGKWKRRKYSGVNKHMHHVHWQSDPDAENRPMRGDLTVDEVVDALNQPLRTEAKSIPDWPIDDDKSFRPYHSNAPYYATIERVQRRLRERGWKVSVDGRYGPMTERCVVRFQREKGLKPDGLIGPKTWRALWATPITG